ncbi:MAG TPA: SDR family oxidoreductase [bacterium]|jgi:NAD(P)-dependent dehydrogenase (short-subunit alcohol dehydrogenase family)
MDAGVTPIALVTGAAGGIGRAISAVFAGAGWTVLATDLAPNPGIDGAARYVAADLAALEGISIVAREAERSGRLDALVNNAAVLIGKPLLETTVDEWDLSLATNARATFLLAQATFPLLRAARGSIVNVSSVHALATSAGVATYAASKGAVAALTRAMALEFAPDGIRVNAVLPGAVDTAMLRAGLRRGGRSGQEVGDLLGEVAQRTALGRVGAPSEVAEAVLFLSDSRRSSFITGQALVVDGGALARLSTE